MKVWDKVIVFYGLGREGFIICGFVMWFFYLGLCKVYMFGDMCILLLKVGDFFIVINGFGWLSSVDFIISEVIVLGVRVLVIIVKFDGVVVVFVIIIVFVFV